VPMNFSTLGQSPYKAYITREPFLFYEMRITARLIKEGLSDDQIVDRIVSENLFQYPTEKSIKGMARACIVRLRSLDDTSLICAIAVQPQNVAKQICLYAFMKQHRLVRDFMLNVIGNKYQQQDFFFSRSEINVFFIQLQEQDDTVASWSDSTITKLKQILMRVLVENEYIDNLKSEHLNPVMLFGILENAIRMNGDEAMLPAFNNFN